MMYSGEPMSLGSPTSPGTGSHNQSSYLPGYLLGDTSSAASPGARTSWLSQTPQSPPTKTYPSNKQNMWSSPAPSQQNLSIYTSPKSESRPRDLIGQRGKEKVGAPPVQGLLDQITSPQASPYTVSTPDKRQLDISGRPGSVSFMADQTKYGTPGLQSESTLDTSIQKVGYSQPVKNPPSPAQLDPFYTQGEHLNAESCLDETWVTVFGFPPAAASFILQQFSQYGNILRHIVSTEGNWMHLHYQSKIQAKKALSKNSKIFGGSIMVGVTPCIDKSVMDSEKENVECLSRQDIFSTPSGGSDVTSCNKSASIRPLTAAYRAAASDHSVVQKTNTPQKSNNVISKAMEYVFGW